MPKSKKTFLEKLPKQLQLEQSYTSLFLGILIVLVAGVLIFNYLKKSPSEVGPAQQITDQAQEDVKPESLPGTYTVKEGDTLFDIAQHYYNDGYKFANLAEANKLASADYITAGQILEIPKLELATSESAGVGGAENQTIWGEKIDGDTYTVVEGDWLSKIAGRAYGDIMAFDKIVQANDIANPDLVEPGQVLQIPR